MEQTILQLPMQSPELPALGQHIGVIYQQPQPPLLPVIRQDIKREVQQEAAPQQEYTVPITIGKPKLAILEELLVFRLLTADLLTERLFQPSMLRDTQKHLQEMEKGRYVRRSFPMKQTRFGSVPFAWGLDLEGYKYLKNIGKSVPERFRSLSDDLHEGYPVSHTLAVNQVLMKAMYLDENDPYLLLRDFAHEKDLNAKPLRVQVPQEPKPTSISPDLWLHFYSSNRVHFCPTIEVNLSRMWQKDWREKVKAYLYCLDAYEKRFGIDVLTVAMIVTTGRKFTQKPERELSAQELHDRKQDERDREKRLTNFLLWTETELVALGERTEADMFRFTNVTLDTISPSELFFGAHWHIPFQESPVSLLTPPRKEDEY